MPQTSAGFGRVIRTWRGADGTRYVRLWWLGVSEQGWQLAQNDRMPVRAGGMYLGYQMGRRASNRGLRTDLGLSGTLVARVFTVRATGGVVELVKQWVVIFFFSAPRASVSVIRRRVQKK